MGGASADRDFLFTGKERRKTHQAGTAIKSSKGKGVFVLSVIARELLLLCTDCSYRLSLARHLQVDND